jgi:hypothetical protein
MYVYIYIYLCMYSALNNYYAHCTHGPWGGQVQLSEQCTYIQAPPSCLRFWSKTTSYSQPVVINTEYTRVYWGGGRGRVIGEGKSRDTVPLRPLSPQFELKRNII